MTLFALLLSMALQTPDPYAAPPVLGEKSACTCPAYNDSDVTITGFVIDAEVILGADRHSVEDRMATIFDVTQSSDLEISGRTRVWHNVSEDNCGVTFDYGKKYSVPARYDENGDLETDSCLMGW
ncbi:hypothetical protein [Hyphococcus luteus]|uniref:Uncharacterized protein n=1 Tax=Hyphococcus luteus TaxID=2058213 RepID=A0A2S7K3J7_9PROT|nr:hypothetical protein [Marinicaulis flavus]PQA87067.1 hypothetical protein CW354_13530 [Marinicaulis flavus]